MTQLKIDNNPYAKAFRERATAVSPVAKKRFLLSLSHYNTSKTAVKRNQQAIMVRAISQVIIPVS